MNERTSQRIKLIRERMRATGAPLEPAELADLYAGLTARAKRRVVYFVTEQIAAGHLDNLVTITAGGHK